MLLRGKNVLGPCGVRAGQRTKNCLGFEVTTTALLQSATCDGLVRKIEKRGMDGSEGSDQLNKAVLCVQIRFYRPLILTLLMALSTSIFYPFPHSIPFFCLSYPTSSVDWYMQCMGFCLHNHPPCFYFLLGSDGHGQRLLAQDAGHHQTQVHRGRGSGISPPPLFFS